MPRQGRSPPQIILAFQITDRRERIEQIIVLIADIKPGFNGPVRDVPLQITEYSFGLSSGRFFQPDEAIAQVIRVRIRQVVNRCVRIFDQLIQQQIAHKHLGRRYRLVWISQHPDKIHRPQLTGNPSCNGHQLLVQVNRVRFVFYIIVRLSLQNATVIRNQV